MVGNCRGHLFGMFGTLREEQEIIIFYNTGKKDLHYLVIIMVTTPRTKS